MKGGPHSFEAFWEYLEGSGGLAAVLAMVILGGVVLIGLRLYLRYKRFRVEGGVSGLRTRKTVKALRADGQLEGELTFSDAVELADTGTIRKKPLEEEIVACVVPIEILLTGGEHGFIYQFEMGEWSEKQVASWIEVVKTLHLPDIAVILEEVQAMRGVVCHPRYDPEQLHRGEKIGDKFWRREQEICAEFAEIDGLSRLRGAAEAHLRAHAPEMLPLPTW